MIGLLAALSIALTQGPASLASADSLTTLRAAVHAHPDSVELLLALGRALTNSTDQVESNFATRMEAKGYLDHAVRLRSNDPRTWLEYGLLIEKQHYGVDAVRALEHAERLAGTAESGLTNEDRADLHEGMGKLYAMYDEDTPTGRRSRNNLVELRRHFELALALEPGRMRVASEVLRMFAERNQWAPYLARAVLLVQARPDDAEAWLFLGLGFHEVGQSARADSAYRRALALASPDLRATLLDISPLLLEGDSARLVALNPSDRAAAGDAYWGMRDPLFLTSENERLSEHFSRVAYADVAFSDPWAGTIGRQSDKGRIWIWFGRPDHYGTGSWSYRGMQRPMSFTRSAMYRYARLNEDSEFELRQVRLESPEWYHPTHPRMVGGVVFQAARFKGDSDRTELVVYGRIPVDSLGKTDSLATGFFAFALDPWRAAVGGRAMVTNAAARHPAHFVAQLNPGRYLVSVEAAGNDRAATKRDTIVIEPAHAGLALSDLLLADAIHASGNARARAELGVEGSTTLAFRRNAPVGVVWEAYGLTPDSSGVSRYHVKLEVRDARGGLVRALRAITLQGNNNGTVLEWDSDRPLGPNRIALEYATVQMEGAGQGEYRMMISVTDRSNGLTASTERRFTIVQ